MTNLKIWEEAVEATAKIWPESCENCKKRVGRRICLKKNKLVKLDEYCEDWEGK